MIISILDGLWISSWDIKNKRTLQFTGDSIFGHKSFAWHAACLE